MDKKNVQNTDKPIIAPVPYQALPGDLAMTKRKRKWPMVVVKGKRRFSRWQKGGVDEVMFFQRRFLSLLKRFKALRTTAAYAAVIGRIKNPEIKDPFRVQHSFWDHMHLLIWRSKPAPALSERFMSGVYAGDLGLWDKMREISRHKKNAWDLRTK